MLAKTGNLNHPYLNKNDSDKKAVIVITSNRGLAGGYNANVVKMITGAGFQKEDVECYTIGNKGREVLERRGYEIKASYPEVIESPEYADAAAICNEVLASYQRGEIGEIYLAYTHFKNTVVHERN